MSDPGFSGPYSYPGPLTGFEDSFEGSFRPVIRLPSSEKVDPETPFPSVLGDNLTILLVGGNTVSVNDRQGH